MVKFWWISQHHAFWRGYEIIYMPIGMIHSPFKDIKGMPIQPTGARGIAGTIELNSEYVNGLKRYRRFFTYYLNLPFASLKVTLYRLYPLWITYCMGYFLQEHPDAQIL